jgi:hypothetical protein
MFDAFIIMAKISTTVLTILWLLFFKLGSDDKVSSISLLSTIALARNGSTGNFTKNWPIVVICYAKLRQPIIFKVSIEVFIPYSYGLSI